MKIIHDRVKISSIKRFIVSRWPLILILFLAGFFRLYKIFDIPPSLNWDEVSHGYNAYSILKTGNDEWGIKFPLIFRAYGDYKLPLYIYLTALAESVFGLNALSVRLISIISGLGLVIVSYAIALKLTRKKELALLSGLLTAISPWSLFLSRVALEANLGAFLFALGMYFFIQWNRDFHLKRLIGMALFWGLSLYTYNSARVLVPLLWLVVFAILIKKRLLKDILIYIIFTLVFFGPISWQFLDKTGGARFNLVSLIDQGAIANIVEKRESSKLPPMVTRAIFNRPTYFIFYSFSNYLANLSPKYLFFRGGSHYQFSLPGHELLYLITAPFLFLGILKVLIRGDKQEKIIIFWFFLSLIPSAITKDAPHVLRTILILPSPMILTAIGVNFVTKIVADQSFFKGNLIVLILVLGVFVSFYRWWNDYQNIYPKAYSWAWQFGYADVTAFIKDNYRNYDRIVVTKRYGEPHEFLLFYLKFPPENYQNDKGKIWDHHAAWYWVDSFDKLEFINDWEIVDRFKIQNTKYKILLVTSPGNYPEGWNVMRTINYLDGKPVFDILENNK